MEQRLKVLILEFTHDKKKFAVMCAVVTIGVLLWARLIILQNVPKTGFAEPDQSRPNPAQIATGTSTDAAPAESEKSRLTELPIRYLDTKQTLTRDYFERLPLATAQPEESPQLPQDTAKSGRDDVEKTNGAERDPLADVQKAASLLHLESVMGGKRPMAVINGNVLAIGDEIDGFVLEQVESRKATLRQGTFRVELKIKN